MLHKRCLRDSNLENVECYMFSLCSYLAPEYFMHGKMNNKIDVYAYGVVLLELLSGRKPISSESPKAQDSLVMWVCEYYRQKVLTLKGLSLICYC